jgi:hypothetical protein
MLIIRKNPVKVTGFLIKNESPVKATTPDNRTNPKHISNNMYLCCTEYNRTLVSI